MIETQERQLALDQLAANEVRLLGLVDGLTPAQWAFRETPERWSIAETLEHVVAVETHIMRVIAKKIQEPGDPEKGAMVANKDSLVLKGTINRTVKFNAPEPSRPIGRWPDPAELINQLRQTRAKTVAFTTETQADLRSHVFPHIAFGDLDCYQWIVLLSRHGERHALQIEEIMADPAYPAGTIAAQA